jgi:hypothetical protein
MILTAAKFNYLLLISIHCPQISEVGQSTNLKSISGGTIIKGAA